VPLVFWHNRVRHFGQFGAILRNLCLTRLFCRRLRAQRVERCSRMSTESGNCMSAKEFEDSYYIVFSVGNQRESECKCVSVPGDHHQLLFDEGLFMLFLLRSCSMLQASCFIHESCVCRTWQCIWILRNGCLSQTLRLNLCRVDLALYNTRFGWQ
jgi:hypothetical protein